jgi:hypothetical protein
LDHVPGANQFARPDASPRSTGADMTRDELITIMAKAMSGTFYGDDERSGYLNHLGNARAALTAIEAAGAVVVPVEATEARIREKAIKDCAAVLDKFRPATQDMSSTYIAEMIDDILVEFSLLLSFAPAQGDDMSVITDEMVNKFGGAYYCAGRDEKGHVESIREGLTAVTPLIRAAALEEAARLAERRHEVWNAGDCYFDGEGVAAVVCDVTACENIAAAIRALIAKEGT